jgi:LPS-assembly protein
VFLWLNEMSFFSKISIASLFFLALFFCPSARSADATAQGERDGFLLKESDIADFGGLALALKDVFNPVSEFIRSKSSPGTIELLDAYRKGALVDDKFRKCLLDDLNRVILGENIFEVGRFAEVKLTAETKKLLDESPAGADVARLNRMLLEQAYKGKFTALQERSVDVSADSLEYDSEKGLMIAQGRVRIRRGGVLIRSEMAVVNIETYDVLAEGDVYFERGSDAWSGERLRYNFQTQRGSFGEFVSFLDPFYVRAEHSYRASEDEYLFHKAMVTTCETDDPIAYIKANNISLVPGRHAQGRNVLLYLGKVPVMYSPYWNQSIGSPNFFSVVPGYNSRMSAFLLTAFNYRLSRYFEAASHIDYRIKRGPGVGQDIIWSSSGNSKGLSTERYMQEEDDFWFFGRKTRAFDIEEEDAWFGDLITYYTHDSWPDEGEDQDYPIDSDRYRIRFFDSHSLGDRAYFLGQFDYLSDPKLIEQFFRDEYKHSPEPENYLVLGYRGDMFSAAFEVEKRLNDFYTAIDRVPQVSIDFTRQEIKDTSIYYEGETAAGFLGKEWESNETNESDYSCFRFDTDNTLYYSMRWFGFLNVTPRAGYRGTVYSKTREDITEFVRSAIVDEDGAETESVSTNTFVNELGSEFRNVYEFGIESSFKTFKVWEAYPGGSIHNLRHIAEPYVNYTFIPEPNVLPENLYQFDEVDEIGKTHNIKIGLINKLQTKKDSEVFDLVNADIWTYYRFWRDEGENDFANFFFNIRSSLLDDWMQLKLDGEFDEYDMLFEKFNVRLSVQNSLLWRNDLEYRFRTDSNSLLYDQLTLAPFANWKYYLYGRYEFDDQDFEAWGLSVERMIECITVRVGAEMEDDDYQFWIQFWFTEFPRGKLGLGV